ncbi:ABC transporter substrate-binding protein [Arthrobacter sp. Soil763]|uniref:ABC transporter substrate-binding protein n=1 Tax=Arthrobacter sp. Soil763 TaxID=1736402 RepID=UPI0006FDC452|nr:ABC transporter substrate-binding protein [Arthrobacter sp. Soil763]KRE79531.1 ABC transporter substrate-binding protein [Arthrobacter sp. Soil763]
MLISRSFLAGSAAKAAAIAAVGALALTGCSSSGGSTTTDSGVKLIESGKLTVCSDIPYEPFEFVKDGKNVGFDMDLAAEVAKDLKVEPNVLTVAFEGIQSGQALNTNQCDVAISGISITDARKTVMDFSTPYLDDDLSLLVTKASGLKNLADLKGKKVGVQQGTTGEEYAKSKGLETIQYENTGLLIQAIKTGGVDAAINNQSVLGFAAKGDDSLVFAETYKTGEKLGIAVKKDNKAMTESVDKTLKRLSDDGTMAKLKTTWFGEAAK